MDASKSKTTQKKPKGGAKAGASSKINDARFAKFETDPRYRLPSRRKAKTALDKRFAHMLKDEEFTQTTQVDRYGRKIKSDAKKKALERLYRVADKGDEEEEEEEKESEEEGDDQDDKIQRELQRVAKKYDPARGGGFSASESDSDSDSDSDADSDSSASSDEEDVEGGRSADTQRFREEAAEVPMGDVTRRIAVVNLDWDRIKSRDLMAVFASFLPKGSGGQIERISIFPSEFGKERMQREELEGPPREIFQKKGDTEEEDSEEEDDEEDDEKVKKELLREDDDEEVDGTALRSYQLDRLRYYYAVMVCSDEATAEALYRATDGHEYQASSNFMDLRFIPDDVTFDDDEPRDSCSEVPSNYKPVEFVTEALQHSKVKLTWDLHPEEESRKDLVKKAFSGTPAELMENDLRAYLASDSEDEDEDELGVIEVVDATEEVAAADEEEEAEDGEAKGTEAPSTVKLSKKELARQKVRAALGLAAEPAKGSSSRKAEQASGAMQITFTPALSEGNSKSKKQGVAAEETTLEKYKRKEKERKERRRQEAVARREGEGGVAGAHEGEDDEDDEDADGGAATGADGDDLGFNDPFFTEEGPADAAASRSKTSIRKEERLRKRAAREAEEKTKAAERVQLEALMAEDGGAPEHYDLREELQAEKAKKKASKGKKGKKGKKGQEDAEADRPTATTHDVDMTDPRFQAVFDDPEFAIDPSNPRFKATPGMQQVLTEMRRKRRGEAEEETASGKQAKKAKTAQTANEKPVRDAELASLVKSVKRKARRV